MKGGEPKAIYLKDYRPSPFTIETVALTFELHPTATHVESVLQIRRQSPDARTLELNGQDMQLLSVAMDGIDLADQQYQLSDDSLTLYDCPDRFQLQIKTQIDPQSNTSLEGLYTSSGNYCTQCEAEGFRKITYFIDRPDIMATYTTRIIADKSAYPVLLSNGNPIESGDLADNRHYVTWHDPYPKPSYLFALVAGNLRYFSDSYTTLSGRQVDLRIYVEPENIDKCDHAMRSLKNAMQWDEQQFGLEYDLDIYMIVAVNDFNMGAMENKGLNIFNSKYVLARTDTATDDDFEGIESIIAHEYFHNWTGNRVTCRDWFQLSLKEGLTVYRDQEFSADMGSRHVKRIQDVRALRSSQFLEDSGPMAHPVRPDSYVEINNFYTATVYNKGAEVVRLYETLFGKDGFRKGMDLYFQRHDGQAVTTDDFYAAMCDANDAELCGFVSWYTQAGTPVLSAQGVYDASQSSYTLILKQQCPATPGQSVKQNYLIPVRMALLNATGHKVPLRCEQAGIKAADEAVLILTETEQRFSFTGISTKPTPSLLRGFSAPVKLQAEYSDEELAFLLAHDDDGYARWEAGQQLILRVLLQALATPTHDFTVPQYLLEAYHGVFADVERDPALVAELLGFPSEAYVGELMSTIDVDGIHRVLKQIKAAFARCWYDVLVEQYNSLAQHAFSFEGSAQRRLKNTCLALLFYADLEEAAALAQRQFETADNMTDSLSALRGLVHHATAQAPQALNQFARRWQNDALVMDKWFSIQATADTDAVLENIVALERHQCFDIKNPNKVRALIGAFAHGNTAHFHRSDGSGYRYVIDRIIQLDALNPQIAARLLAVFTRWRRYDAQRQEMMRAQLQRVLTTSGLSADCFEVASKSLAD